MVRVKPGRGCAVATHPDGHCYWFVGFEYDYDVAEAFAKDNQHLLGGGATASLAREFRNEVDARRYALEEAKKVDAPWSGYTWPVMVMDGAYERWPREEERK